MESIEISNIATVLRDNGAEILNGLSKLSLTSNLISALNNTFTECIDQRELLSSSFQVINNTSNKFDDYEDLQFLHDFVQRVVALKVTSIHKSPDLIDITKFKNLKLLELQKINTKLLVGIQGLRSQLQFLICFRCISTLSEVLEKCGGDESDGFPWNNLKEAVFSHNSLQTIDDSIKFCLSIQTLDLSHNEIQDASSLKYLVNLKQLNLGFNKISSVPAFTGQICNRLQVLVLKNNFIEDITEISSLLNLCELDLSENCLIQHNSLVPIAYLAALQFLNLNGNPLSFHPQHRSKTASYLHANTGTVRFFLDRMILSKNEKSLIGSLYPRILQRSFQTQPANLEMSQDRQKRIRHATISDSEVSPVMDSSLASINSLITAGEHLETKRQIEQLREQYGEKWLHSQAGSLVQDCLGLEKTYSQSTPYGSADILIQAEIKPQTLKLNDAVSKEELNKTEGKSEQYHTAQDTFSEENLYENNKASSDSSDDDEDLGDERLYLATIEGDVDPVFIVVTKTYILERDCTIGKEITRWTTDTLVSCERNDLSVHLGFDTLNSSKKERKYILDSDESVRLEQALKEIIDEKPPEPDFLTKYKCLKCFAQFTFEKKIGLFENQECVCPVCKSPNVLEDDD